jgi:hypothetical protein
VTTLYPYLQQKVLAMFSPNAKKNNKNTIDNLEKKYLHKVCILLANIPKREKTVIFFPQFRAQDIIAITPDVATCCVIILYNNENKYVLGHFNSINYENMNASRNLFRDDFPEMIKALQGNSPIQAIVIGGDQCFFKHIIEFLETTSVSLTASYLDEHGSNHIAENLTMKTVMFEPRKKVATVFSPSLSEAEIILSHQHFRLANDQQHLIHLRSLTLDQVGYENQDIAVSDINSTKREPEKYKRRFSTFSELIAGPAITMPEQKHDELPSMQKKM